MSRLELNTEIDDLLNHDEDLSMFSDTESPIIVGTKSMGEIITHALALAEELSS